MQLSPKIALIQYPQMPRQRQIRPYETTIRARFHPSSRRGVCHALVSFILARGLEVLGMLVNLAKERYDEFVWEKEVGEEMQNRLQNR